MSKNRGASKDKDVVLLKDLAPRKQVIGGAGRILFGQGIATGGEVKAQRSSRNSPTREKRS